MKKMIKLSLVAAVAVTSFATTAAAKPMEEAIKDVDVSGLMRYRYGFKNVDKGASTESQHVKLVVGTKSKVNDKVTASLKFVGAVSQADSVATPSPAMNVMKFTYKDSGLTATAGLQELKTPWTDAADGARANGLLVTKKLGAITVAGALFRDSQMGTDRTAALNANDLTAIAAIGKAGPVSYQAWYLNIGNGTTAAQTIGSASSNSLPSGGDAVAVLATVKAGPAKIDVSYASLEGEKSAELKKQTLTKAIATVKAGPATIVAGMAIGGEDGDLVTFDADAKVGFQSWNIRAGQDSQADLQAMTVAAVVPVSGVALKAQYTFVEYDDAKVKTTETDASEILLQASYKMSKNFNTYFRYAMVDQDVKTTATGVTANTKFDRTRIELAYKF